MDWNPYVSLGYVDTFQPNASHTSQIQGPMLAVQSAVQGPGIAARAIPSAGMVTLGGQYGFDIPHTPLTVTPSAGMAYVGESFPELPMKTPFALGLSVGMPIGLKARLTAEYLHLSNAGLRQPNIGLDLGSIMVGYPF